MKKCPYCVEKIQANSIKCEYCGENLEEKKITPKIRGWLIILAITMYLQFIILYYQLLMKEEQDIYLYSNGYRELLLSEKIMNTILFIFIIISLGYFHKKKKIFPMIFKVYMLIFIISYLTYYYFSLGVIEINYDIKYVIFGLIFPIIWIFYLTKSVRVKNTFIN